MPDDRVALFGEGGGQAVVACAPERGGRARARRAAAADRDRRRRLRSSGVPVELRCAEAWQTCYVRHLRHPCARARRRAARATSACSRCSTAARSRPGSPSPRRPADGCSASMGLVAQVFDEQNAARPARRDRDRAHALLDDGLDALGERAAARPATAARARSRSATTATSTNAAELRAELGETASARRPPPTRR